MSEQRPFGSYDWTIMVNIIYLIITDRYVYTKVLEHMEKQKKGS